MEIRYAYQEGLKKIIHVSMAQRGLSCGCVCADCGTALEAVKGHKRIHYFRHANGKDCSGESAIHLYAKQVIAEGNTIRLPGERIAYEAVRLEQVLGTRRPDITVRAGGEQLHFEIRVTNAVCEDKRRFYRDGQHRCVEIDLSDRRLWLLPPEELKELILEDSSNKHIIYWGDDAVVSSRRDSSNDFVQRLLAYFVFLIIVVFASKGIFPKKRYGY